MCLPLITPGGHRAYKNSKKPGYGVFIEQFPGGAAQWLQPQYLAAIQAQQQAPNGGGGGMNGAGGLGAAPPNFPPNGMMPPHVHGQAGMPVFPQQPGPPGGMAGGPPMGGGMPQMPVGLPPQEQGDMQGGVDDVPAGGLEGGQQGGFDLTAEDMQNLAAQQGGGDNNALGEGETDMMDAAAFLNPNVPGPNTFHLTPAALGGHHGPVHAANPLLGFGNAFANWAIQTPNTPATFGQNANLNGLNLTPGVLGGHTGPVHTANSLLGVGNAFANWAIQTPPAGANGGVVKPWYLFPNGPPPTAKKKRKAFVVRRIKPEEQVHETGQGGVYPRVRGIGEFRGGRFY